MNAQRHEFELIAGTIVEATMRSSDLVVEAVDGAVTATVELTPHGSGGEAVARDTRVELRGDRLVIVVPKSLGLLGTGSVTVHVTVPTGAGLEVETGSGDVRTDGALSTVRIKTGSGDVTIRSADDLRLIAGSGDVVVREAGTLTCATGSGDQQIGLIRGAGTTRAGSGDIAVDEASEFSASTGSGDIVLGATTVLGRARTASGDIVIRGARSGRVEAKTASGDVNVAVAAGTAALLDCATVSGETHSDLDGVDAPAERDERVELRLRSVSGSIYLKRVAG